MFYDLSDLLSQFWKVTSHGPYACNFASVSIFRNFLGKKNWAGFCLMDLAAHRRSYHILMIWWLNGLGMWRIRVTGLFRSLLDFSRQSVLKSFPRGSINQFSECSRQYFRTFSVGWWLIDTFTRWRFSLMNRSNTRMITKNYPRSLNARAQRTVNKVRSDNLLRLSEFDK